MIDIIYFMKKLQSVTFSFFILCKFVLSIFDYLLCDTGLTSERPLPLIAKNWVEKQHLLYVLKMTNS